MKTFFFATLCCIALNIQAQYAPPPVDHASSLASLITGDEISRHLHVLASAAFEGRETGTPGNAKAAQYISDQFIAAGIPPVESVDGYFQQVIFSKVSLQDMSLNINGTEYAHLKDFIIPATSMPADEIAFDSDEIVFLGYGIDDPVYSDYAEKVFEGKAILIYKGEPVDTDGKSWITGNTQLSEWSKDLDKKLRAAAAHRVALVYVIEDQFRAKVSEERMSILGGRTIMGIPDVQNSEYVPHVLISSNIAGVLMGSKSEKVIKTRDKIRARGKPKTVKIPVQTRLHAQRSIDSTPGANVLGYIEGVDSLLKDQVIVISAHYDHLGKRGDDIFYGADDNGSGTSGVIAIASAFAEAKRKGVGPRRSVLCLLVTGEEKGLLGSEYYSEFPVFPLKNTVADINIDMIGRMDDKHSDPHYTYVIGADRLSSELHEINEAVNEKYTQLQLDYTYNAESDPNRFYYRSDHYNFAKHGIPAIFYFSGVHEDYHRPTDTVDKIMFDKAANIARLAFHTAWELANRDARIKVDRS
ncbi:MAG TPA: M28 family peptidase [Saprospiraceae bacterium]|nr:M28 family peptidase [Saprospiraceae bacterium]